MSEGNSGANVVTNRGPLHDAETSKQVKSIEDLEHENATGTNDDLSPAVRVKFVYTCETVISRADYDHIDVTRVDGTGRSRTNDEIQKFEEHNDEMTLVEQLMESEDGTLFVKVEDV
jgi:hypothetical protein